MIELIRKAKRVYLAGNGGSAANAIHIANDLVSVGIKAQALTGDIATLTAIANDFSYEQVFSRQLEVLGEAGDLLIALSGSGRSVNILDAIDQAHSKGMDTLAIVGDYGIPTAANTARYYVRMGLDMQEAEEAQLVWGHEVMRSLREETV